MTMPIALPDWMPWWLQLVVLMALVLLVLAFLAMPFVVFALRGRLDFIEAQLDDIHAELRMLASRIPEPISAARYQAMRTAPQPQVQPERWQSAAAASQAAAQMAPQVAPQTPYQTPHQMPPQPAAPDPGPAPAPRGPEPQAPYASPYGQRAFEPGPGMPHAPPQTRYDDIPPRRAMPEADALHEAERRRPAPAPSHEVLRAEPRDDRWTPRLEEKRQEPRLRWPPR